MQCTSLTELALVDWASSATDITYMKVLTRLTSLDLDVFEPTDGGVPPSDADFASLFRALPSLTALDLEVEPIPRLILDQTLVALSQCGRLTTLRLTNVDLLDAGFATLAAGCAQLSELGLLNCFGWTPAAVAALATRSLLLRDLSVVGGPRSVLSGSIAEIAKGAPLLERLKVFSMLEHIDAIDTIRAKRPWL